MKLENVTVEIEEKEGAILVDIYKCAKLQEIARLTKEPINEKTIDSTLLFFPEGVIVHEK